MQGEPRSVSVGVEAINVVGQPQNQARLVASPFFVFVDNQNNPQRQL